MNERPRHPEITDPVTVSVNGKEIEAQKGELLIDACERNGTYIPRFCYHPRMSPVGMCRMCLVEVDTGRGPALQPSCMMECGANMVVETETDVVRKAQEGVLEFLLINHPLDCPVCDKGGECPLQDQTMAYGPGESRWLEEKRHYVKPIPVSETVLLDRERCILCDRCTRFADEVAGDPLIHFIDRGANTQVNTFPGEPFASYFSGNTVQICPVGALTAKPYRFKARPWDLQQVESTCTGCSVGCRITVQSSRNEVLRYIGVDSDPVNWSWLCDKGRFGFEAVNAPERLGAPLVREGDTLMVARWRDALDAAATAISGTDADRVAVIGGSRLTNESARAWARLAHDVVGTPHVDAQIGDGLPPEVLGLPRATIDEVCAPGGTVVVLAGDVKEELPVLFLRLKHAALNDGVRLIEVAPTRTGLSPYATESIIHRPGEAAAAVAELLERDEFTDLSGLAGLKVVLGRASVAEAASLTVDAAAVLAARPGTTFLPALRRANVVGAVLAGLRPGPGGSDTAATLAAAAEGRIDTLILLGADPVADFPDAALAERALARTRTVIAVDQFLTASSHRADIVLAAAGFAEVAGTTTNLEGRVSVLHAKVTAPGTARPDWLLAAELADRLGQPLEDEPLFDDATTAALAADANADGIVAPAGAAWSVPTWAAPAPTPSSGTDGYALRLVAGRRLYDQGTLLQHCPSSAGLAGEAVARIGTDDASKLGVIDGVRVRLTARERSISLPARVDAAVPKGTVAVAVGQSGADPRVLIDAGDPWCEVRVEVPR